MAYPIVELKTGREASVGFHHPWIFSGAIENVPPEVPAGGLVHIADRNGRIIGTGSFEGGANIAVRVFTFEETVIDAVWMISRIERAHSRRLLLGYGPDTDTTGYRVVFSEADGLAGLVIDRYADVLVLQISIHGMKALRPLIIDACKKLFAPQAIIEKKEADVVARFGELSDVVEFQEHGIKFVADILHGQKTGFFLDQKDLRTLASRYANGKAALNLFSYSGAMSIALLKAGAVSVHTVDESARALELCVTHARMNDIEVASMPTEEADIFSWLNDHREPAYDMVVLDPPALTKTRKDAEVAGKAYHFLNRAAMRLVKNDGILVTSSCSHFFSEDDFIFTLRRASVQAGVELEVLHAVRQAGDHPQSIYWPEGQYLKSFICRVRR